MRQLTLFDEEELTGIEDDAPDFVRDAWRKAKQDLKQNFKSLQELPFEEKIERQEGIAREFYEEMQKRGHECHVSVGGLDSIVLLIWLKSIPGNSAPGIQTATLAERYSYPG